MVQTLKHYFWFPQLDLENVLQRLGNEGMALHCFAHTILKLHTGLSMGELKIKTVYFVGW